MAELQEKPKGFLIVAPWEITSHGGVNGVIRNLVEHMLRDGHVVPLIIQNSWKHRKIGWSTLARVPVASMRLRSPVAVRKHASNARALLTYLASLPLSVWTILKLLRCNKTGVINIHYPALNAVTFILLRRIGLFSGTLILSFHGSDARWAASLTGIQARVWRYILRCADQITCVSHQLAEMMASNFPVTKSKLHVVHNGVDFSKFAVLRREKRLFEGNPCVISIASFDYVKGVDVFLRAVSLIVMKCPSVRFILVGESGQEDEALVRLSQELGIESYLEWHCNVPHSAIPALLMRADLFVLPSRDEGLGLALLEAGAAGLPTIATCVGGTPEVIQDHHNGLLVPSEDPQSIANAAFWMFENSDMAIEMGRAFQRSVYSNFDWGLASRRYVEVGSRHEIHPFASAL